MTATIIFAVFLGWLSYWIVKIPATIKGDSPINTVKDFFASNWKEFALSIIGITLLIVAGKDLPESWGKITGPFTAFTTGGSLPSIFMNVTALFKK